MRYDAIMMFKRKFPYTTTLMLNRITVNHKSFGKMENVKMDVGNLFLTTVLYTDVVHFLMKEKKPFRTYEQITGPQKCAKENIVYSVYANAFPKQTCPKTIACL